MNRRDAEGLRFTQKDRHRNLVQASYVISGWLWISIADELSEFMVSMLKG